MELKSGELEILDIVINVKRLLKSNLYEFVFNNKISRPLSKDIDELLRNLIEQGFIEVSKGEYNQEYIFIKESRRQDIIILLNKYLANLKQEKIRDEYNKDLTRLISFVSKIKLSYDENKNDQIFFSDYDYNGLRSFCDELKRKKLVFQRDWSSRKHSYQEYYLRMWPFKLKDLFNGIISENIDIESLNQEDWQLIGLILLVKDNKISIDDLKTNFSHYTTNDFTDILLRLEEKNVIIKDNVEIKIVEGVKNILKEYFLINIFEEFKNKFRNEIINHIMRSPSNILSLILIKRILSSGNYNIENIHENIRIYKIPRTSVRENISDIDEASKLGMLFLTSSEVIILADILKELDEWFKESLSTEPIMFIPSNDTISADKIFEKIFNEAKNYIKIQDEYINEYALKRLYLFSPKNIPIMILTSVKGGWDTNPTEMESWVNEIKKTRKIDFVFIGRNKNNEAPFHSRTIITDGKCWKLDTSIKQIGKSKDMFIKPITKQEDITTIETEFDFWYDVSEETMTKRNVKKRSFEDWVNYKRRAK